MIDFLFVLVSKIDSLYAEAILPGFIEEQELGKQIHHLRFDITKVIL